MQKVYRLLRNNQETGPYTLDEILQLNLKPFDLVWVDGRSAAWRYPAEIETLKAYVPEAIQPSNPFEPVATAAMEQPTFTQPCIPKTEPSRNIFVSMPGSACQSPVEQQPAKPQSQSQSQYQPQSQPQTAYLHNDHQRFANPGQTASTPVPEPEAFQTNYSRSLNDVEEDYTNWVYRQKAGKKSKIPKKDLAVAAVIVLLIVGGYFVISKPSVIEPITEQKSSPVIPQQQANTTTLQNETVNHVEASSLPAVDPNQERKPSGNSPTIAERRSNNVKPQNNEAPPADEETVAANEEIKESNTQAPQKENTTTSSKKEKKKLGEMIRGIFNKKEKKENPKEETGMEEPTPATNRQATKRNEVSVAESEIDNAALAEMVDISSNAPENWMMGVTGLKLTLRNRNTVALQTAAVQVLYYDENNQLLDRKSVYFNNVPARGKMTLAAPDHKFADHVDFKVLAVTAKADHYASNQ